MMKWTSEQLKAIEESGKNIIVSAGAGSGKTAVLTERVIRKVKSGISIENLLVLTFTKAAAFEMKERIKKELTKELSLSKELELVDSSYITNFDSFSTSIVKKYYYLLGISRDFSIINQTVLDYQSTKILTEIFEEKYNEEDERFLDLIASFCVKKDQALKKDILDIYNKIDLKIDKKRYLDNYINEYFNESFIEKSYSNYEKLLFNEQDKIKTLLSDLSLVATEDYYNKIALIIEPFINKDYHHLFMTKVDIPKIPFKSGEEVGVVRAKLKEACEALVQMISAPSKEKAIKTYMSTKSYIEEIIEIISLLDERLNKFKAFHNRYTFSDIAKMSINLIKNNPEIRKEMQDNFEEIMVDEYQDTSDLQEELITLIAQDNLYMVGDIKQSIYQFRNANPHLFKSKYKNYAKGLDGIKIDLQNNFRSRREVIDDINHLFEKIMTEVKGGISYHDDQAMVFANTSYEKEEISSRKMKILNIDFEGYAKEDTEIFAMLRDIENKINNAYQVLDKQSGLLRPVRPGDFAILIDRSNSFDKLKKIFEHEGIAVSKFTSTKVLDYDEIYIIKNILQLIKCLDEKDFSNNFRYAYTSIARSFLFAKTDQVIFDSLNKNLIFESDILNLVKELQKDINYLNVKELLKEIYKRFAFVEKIPTASDLEPALLRLDYIESIAEECDNLGFDYKYLIDLIEVAISEQFKMEINLEPIISDRVTLRTLHGSKGLEYPICYFPFLTKKFNTDDMKSKFVFSDISGIISPYKDEGLRYNFFRELYKFNYYQDIISERIRLFYVALTRAKEEINILTTFNIEKEYSEKERPISFQELLFSVYPLIKKDMLEIKASQLYITKDYTLVSKKNYKENLKKAPSVKVKEYYLDNPILNEESYSKTSFEIVSPEEQKYIDMGNRLHYLLELVDLKKPKLDKVNVNDQKIIQNFLNIGLDFSSAEIYQEYEFITEEDGSIKHGVIDLILVYPDKVIVIDYKLKSTSDKAYEKQLMGYKKYIENKLSKRCETYLYSLIDNKLVRIV